MNVDPPRNSKKDIEKFNDGLQQSHQNFETGCHFVNRSSPDKHAFKCKTCRRFICDMGGVPFTKGGVSIFDAVFNEFDVEDIDTDVVPSNYPNDHPLGVVGSADMHWPMMSTYFTMKLEGKVADIPGEEIITPFAMHPATNPLYRTLSFELPETMALYPNEIRNYQFNLDLEKTINGNAGVINLNEIGHSMGNVENTVRFVDNLSAAWTLIE